MAVADPRISLDALLDPQYAGLTAQVEAHPLLKGHLPCSAKAINYVLLPLSDLTTLVAALAALQHHQHPAAAAAPTNYLSGAYVVVQEPTAASAAAPGLKLRRLCALQLGPPGNLSSTQLLLCDGTWARLGDVREGLGGQEAPLQELAWCQAQDLSPPLKMHSLVHTLCRLAALFAAQADTAVLVAKGVVGLAADAAASLPQMVPSAVQLQNSLDPTEALKLALAWAQRLSAAPVPAVPPAVLPSAVAAAGSGAGPLVAAAAHPVAAPAEPHSAAAAKQCAAAGSSAPAVAGSKRPRGNEAVVLDHSAAAGVAPPDGKRTRAEPRPSQEQQQAQHTASQRQPQEEQQQSKKHRKEKHRKEKKEKRSKQDKADSGQQQEAGQPSSRRAETQEQQDSKVGAERGQQQAQLPAGAARKDGQRGDCQKPAATGGGSAAEGRRPVAAQAHAAGGSKAGASAAAAGGAGDDPARSGKGTAAGPIRRGRGFASTGAAADRLPWDADERDAPNAAARPDAREGREARESREGREGSWGREEGGRGRHRSRSRLRPGPRVTRSSRSLSRSRAHGAAGGSPRRDADGRRPGAGAGRQGRSRSRSRSGGRMRVSVGSSPHRDGRRPGAGAAAGRRGKSPTRSRSGDRRRSRDRPRDASRDRQRRRGSSPDGFRRRREAEGAAGRGARHEGDRAKSPPQRRSSSSSRSSSRTPPRPRRRSPYLGPKPAAPRAPAAQDAAAADAAQPGVKAAGHCEVCQKPCTHQCSGCRRAYYCSSECQRFHWNEGHRAECSSQTGAAQTGPAGQQQEQQQPGQPQGGDAGADMAAAWQQPQHFQPQPEQMQPLAATAAPTAAAAAAAAAGAATAGAQQQQQVMGTFDLRAMLTQRRVASGGQEEPSPRAGVGQLSALQRLALPASGLAAQAGASPAAAAAAGGGGGAPPGAASAASGAVTSRGLAPPGAAAGDAAGRPGTGGVFDRLQVLDRPAVGDWGDAHLQHDQFPPQQQSGGLVSEDWVQALAANVVTTLSSTSAAQAEVESLPRESREYAMAVYDMLLGSPGWQATLGELLHAKGRAPSRPVTAAGGIYQFLEQLPGVLFDRHSKVLTLDPQYHAAAQAYKMQAIMRSHIQQEEGGPRDQEDSRGEGGPARPHKRQHQQQQQAKEVNPALQKRLGSPPPLQADEAQQLLSDTLQEVEVQAQQQRSRAKQSAAAAAKQQQSAAAAAGAQSKLEQHPAYAHCVELLQRHLQSLPQWQMDLDPDALKYIVQLPPDLLGLAGGIWGFLGSVKGITFDRKRRLLALTEPPAAQQQHVRQPILPPPQLPPQQQQRANAVVVDLRGPPQQQPQRTVVDLRGSARPPVAAPAPQFGALSPDIQQQIQQHALQLGQALPMLRPGSAGGTSSAGSSREPSVAASPRINSPVMTASQQQLQVAPWAGAGLVRLPNRRQLLTLLEDWEKTIEKKIARKNASSIDMEEAAALLPALLRCYVEPKGPWTAQKLLHDNVFALNLTEVDGKTTVSVPKPGSKRRYAAECPKWDPQKLGACSSGAACERRHPLPVAPGFASSNSKPLHGNLI